MQDLFDTAMHLLWLLSVVHVHRLHANAQSSGVDDGYVEAARRLSLAVARRVETEWSAARAADSRKASNIERADVKLTVSIERRLLEPAMECCSWLLAQTEEKPNQLSTAFHAALHSLVERLHVWLEELMATSLPAAQGWQYPVQTSTAVGQWPSSVYHSYSSGVNWCRCADCSAMKRFLQSSTERTMSLRAAKALREHVEQRLSALGNTHLQRVTLHTGSPLTLQVTKTKQVLPVVRQRRQQLQQMLTRVEVALAALRCGNGSEPSASQPGRGTKRDRQVIDVEDEKEEAEETGQEEKQKETAAGKRGQKKRGRGAGRSATTSGNKREAVRRRRLT